MIDTEIPTLEDISPSNFVEVHIDGKLQYYITDKVQMLNLRLWAKANKAEHRLMFKWDGGQVTVEKNRLRGDTVGFFDADTLIVKALLFSDTPTQFFK